MSKANPYTIAYAGLDRDTWFLLVNEPSFNVKLAALIPSLLEHRTFNPCNALLKYAYRRYAEEKLINIVFWKGLLRAVSPLLSSVWRRYGAFVISIIEQKTLIVDFENTNQAISQMQKYSIDLLIVNVWDLLPVKLIDTPTYKTINIHPSLLPQYRGAVPTLMTLKNHDNESGVSYIILSADVDKGDLIGQHRFAVSSNDFYDSIEQKIAIVVESTFIKDVKAYLAAKAVPKPQDTRKQSTTPRYYAYMKIDWQKERAVDIYNKVNAYPYIEAFDYCYMVINERKIPLKRARMDHANIKSTAPGSVKIISITMYVQAAYGLIICTLFKDIGFKDSIYLLLLRKEWLAVNNGGKYEN